MFLLGIVALVFANSLAGDLRLVGLVVRFGLVMVEGWRLNSKQGG